MGYAIEIAPTHQKLRAILLCTFPTVMQSRHKISRNSSDASSTTKKKKKKSSPTFIHHISLIDVCQMDGFGLAPLLDVPTTRPELISAAGHECADKLFNNAPIRAPRSTTDQICSRPVPAPPSCTCTSGAISTHPTASIQSDNYGIEKDSW